MNSVYATILTAPFLPRALALATSILQHNSGAAFSFFCVDAESADVLTLLNLPRCRVYSEDEYTPPELRTLRSTRTLPEYCWTAKPFVLRHLLQTESAAGWVVYLDSDTLSFGDVDIVLRDAGSADFLLAPHHFSGRFASYAISAGLYNGGYVAFRNSPVGHAALARWRDLCFEACPATPIGGAYADQKYLERLLIEFPSGAECNNPGLDAGPWNIEQYRVCESAGRIVLNNVPLLLYHFQSLRVLSKSWIDLYSGDVRLTSDVRALIYRPYLEALARAYATLRKVTAITSLGMSRLASNARGRVSFGKRVALGQANLCHHALFR